MQQAGCRPLHKSAETGTVGCTQRLTAAGLCVMTQEQEAKQGSTDKNMICMIQRLPAAPMILCNSRGAVVTPARRDMPIV
jgi:hypothetical protein